MNDRDLIQAVSRRLPLGLVFRDDLSHALEAIGFELNLAGTDRVLRHFVRHVEKREGSDAAAEILQIAWLDLCDAARDPPGRKLSRRQGDAAWS